MHHAGGEEDTADEQGSEGKSEHRACKVSVLRKLPYRYLHEQPLPALFRRDSVSSKDRTNQNKLCQR